MNREQREWWRIALELKLRKMSGDAFQDFFSTVMEARHGDDFVRVRPFGQKGDKGCDGYLKSTGCVFGCYGAVNGDGGKVDYLVGKMQDDFAKAKGHLSAIMKSWRMAHNLVDGLPVHAVQAMDQLEKDNPGIPCNYFGRDSFEQIVFELPEEKISDLLGPTTTPADNQNLQTEELRDLISAVAAGSEQAIDPVTIKPVPIDKLDLNNLSSHWRYLISGGWQNAHHVRAYIERHPNALIGEQIASVFRARYRELRSQALPPDEIMASLCDSVVEVETASPARKVAAQALLAYLFESCDIFEDVAQAAS